MKANSVLETVGNTPHIRINRLFGDKAEVWVKSERANPGEPKRDQAPSAEAPGVHPACPVNPSALLPRGVR